MFFEPKKIATILVNKKNEDGSESSAPMKSESTFGDEDPCGAIAQDVILAVKNGSANDLAVALRGLVDYIQSME